MNAYIKTLERQRDAALPSAPPLRQQFLDWYAGLPEIARHRPFSMVEFEAALGTQGKYISPVLMALGWCRRRRWSTQGQYFRYWEPPK